MNLILQGLSTQRHIVEQIASLARPRSIVAIGEHAYRCLDISYNDEVKSQIDIAAWAAKLDLSLIHI